MGRRYRYRRSRRQNSAGLVLGVLVLIVLWEKYWVLFLIGGLIALAIYFFRRKQQEESTSEEYIHYVPPKNPSPTSATRSAESPSYASKGSIMTDCEKEYFQVLKQLVEPKYTVQPQINLATIVSKESHSKYRSELFRNIDFGIFDKDYNIKVLIEINDKTHTQADRIQRDKKVNQICAEAGIPLITFWTKYGINPDYIKDRLEEHLDFNNNAPTPSVDIRDNSDYMPKDFL